MKSWSHQIPYKWVVITLGSSFLLVWITFLLLTTYLEGEIRSTIYRYNGKVSSIDVNLFTRRVLIKNLQWSSIPDSLNAVPHSFRLNSVTLDGISLFPLLVHKTIHVNKIMLDSGKVLYNKNIKQPIQEVVNSKYTVFKCHSISLNTIDAQIIADTVVTASVLLTLHLTDAAVWVESNNTLHYSLKNSTGIGQQINFSRQEGMYGGTIKQLSFNTQEEKIILDSILLIPNFSKFKFAHYVGDQIVRLNISIPKLTFEGVAFDKLIDSTLVVEKIVVHSFESFSFKDKRIPFVNETDVPLPMESFLNLSWKIKIDSILIHKSRMTIEEFPVKGVASGITTLDEVRAIFTGLNNRIQENSPVSAALEVTGLVMNSGRFKAFFQFPLDGSANYYANGSISKMSFAELNPVLTRVANIRVKSGYLNSLTFNFTYTEFTSNGHLDIDYADLHITSLNKNKQTTNDLRTLFVNAVVKNNRDQSGPTAKAAGIINIERNRKKSIFNVVRMSILDGLRSSILRRNKNRKV